MHTILIMLGSILSLSTFGAAPTEKNFEWYAESTADLKSGTTKSMMLGTDTKKLSLLGGRTCEISKVSRNNSRQILCGSDKDQIEFTVQCDSARPNDRAQIRFRSMSALVDFVEVGCKSSSSKAPTFAGGQCLVAKDGYVWKISRTTDTSYVVEGWQGNAWGNETEFDFDVLANHKPVQCPLRKI